MGSESHTTFFKIIFKKDENWIWNCLRRFFLFE